MANPAHGPRAGPGLSTTLDALARVTGFDIFAAQLLVQTLASDEKALSPSQLGSHRQYVGRPMGLGPTARRGRNNPRRPTPSTRTCSCFRVGDNVERGPEPIREQRRANCCNCSCDSESECVENPSGAPGRRAAAPPRAGNASTASYYRACSPRARVRCERLRGCRKPHGPVTTPTQQCGAGFTWRAFSNAHLQRSRLRR
jgi:hypothetical protein